jgi:hypothetical protein
MVILEYFTSLWNILRHLVYFVAFWYILWPFGIFCGHLVYVFYDYLVYFSRFGILYQEKSGNPAVKPVRGGLIYFVVIWNIFPHFGIFYRDKSGNPVL